MKTLEGTNPSARGAGRSLERTRPEARERILSSGVPLLKSEMRAVFMMVTDILGEQPLQMAFIQRNNVVQEVSSAAPHPPLRDPIPPWASE